MRRSGRVVGVVVTVSVLVLVGRPAWASSTGSVSGVVTDTSGNPLDGICVSDSDNAGSAQTDATGHYLLSGIPSGTISVNFMDCQQQVYASASDGGVVVPDGGTATANASLEKGISIQGHVTDATTGAPVSGVCVFASNPAQSYGEGTSTDSNGNYTAVDLRPDSSYWVEFDSGCHSPGPYEVQWYNDKTSQQDADLLSAAAGTTLTGIDGHLQPNPDAPGPPAVTSVSPSSGPLSGGSVVTINGTGFNPGSSVTFGGRAAYRTTPVNSTEIQALAPPGTAGTVDIVVTDQMGSSAKSAADQFTYDPTQANYVPEVTSVTPASGDTSGYYYVDIRGQHLFGTQGVYFGDTEASSAILTSDTEIQAYAPPHASGTVDVVVDTEPLGPTSPSPADRFTFVTPATVTGVTPAKGVAGSVVRVTGTRLSNASFYFGTVPAGVVAVLSDNSVLVQAPANAAGTVDVTAVIDGVASNLTPADRFTFLT